MGGFLDSISEEQKLKSLKYVNKAYAVVYAIFRMLLLLSIGFIILYPLLYMVITSIMHPLTFVSGTRIWIPTEFLIKENYDMAFEALDYGRSMLNTFKYEIASAFLEICTCALVGYGFARFNFKGKKLLTAVLFLTILVPDMIIIMPRTANFANLDFLGIFGGIEKLVERIALLSGNDISQTFDLTPYIMNTGWALWLPSLFATGLRSGILIYIYIQFFNGLPRELEEAAWVDGAGPFKTFLRIAVPSSTVVFITVTVFAVIWHWNDSFLADMYFTDKQTLAIALANVETYIGNQYGLYMGRLSPQQAAITMASCLLFIAPILIFYLFIQRGFVESIDRVGITG